MVNSISKLFNLKNKNIVLTGSAGRLGANFAHILSQAGANVILLDIDEKSNKKLEKDIKKKYGRKSSSYSIDISDNNLIQSTAKEIYKKYGRIDVLINNAYFRNGISENQNKNSLKLETFPIEFWKKSIDVNLSGFFLCCKEFGGIMAKQKKGVIVNISSIYGINGADQRIYGNSKLNSQISYSAVKGAMTNLTRYLAAYWHNQNIRVNTLTLGGVMDKSYMKKDFVKKYSEKTMLKRLANEDEYNGSLLYLVSDASSYMTGANLIVDGGWTAW